MRKIKKGLTLIELIAVLAITPIVLMAINSAVITGYRLFFNGTRLSNVQEQTKYTLNTLSNEIKNSRYYMDTDELAASGMFSSSPGIVGNGICYIEGYDNTRVLYTMNIEGGKPKVYKYKLENVVNDSYAIQENASSQAIYTKISPQLFDVYKGSAYDNNRIVDNSRITNIGKIGSDTAQFIFFDTFDWKTYLITKDSTGSQYRKYVLKSNLDDRDTIASSQQIMKYISEIVVDKDEALVDNKKKCRINVKAEDGGKEKELSTDVYIFERV